MEAYQSTLSDIPFSPELGQGAVFWVHISTEHQTQDLIQYWKVTLEHEDKLWKGEISSNQPAKILKAPRLSGIFQVTVEVMDNDGQVKTIRSINEFQTDIGCNLHCASMIGIEANEQKELQYWTVWNSFCHYEDHPLFF